MTEFRITPGPCAIALGRILAAARARPLPVDATILARQPRLSGAGVGVREPSCGRALRRNARRPSGARWLRVQVSSMLRRCSRSAPAWCGLCARRWCGISMRHDRIKFYNFFCLTYFLIRTSCWLHSIFRFYNANTIADKSTDNRWEDPA